MSSLSTQTSTHVNTSSRQNSEQNLQLAQDFIKFSIAQNVLRFGTFTTKAGRVSPYFFNAGLFFDGMSAWRLAQFYAQFIVEKSLQFDVLFGPAYKGISLAVNIACALQQFYGINKAFAFNRKEAKTHGEGGNIIGAPLQGRILVVDDVISAGTSIKEALGHIKQAGAQITGVVVALDRMEKSGDAQNIGAHTAIQTMEQSGIHVHAIANLKDMLSFLERDKDLNLSQYLDAIKIYQTQYCI